MNLVFGLIEFELRFLSHFLLTINKHYSAWVRWVYMMLEISTHKMVVISVIVIILRGQLRVTLAPSMYLTVPICLFLDHQFRYW